MNGYEEVRLRFPYHHRGKVFVYSRMLWWM